MRPATPSSRRRCKGTGMHSKPPGKSPSASARIPRGRTRHMPRGALHRASSRTTCASSDRWPEKVHPYVVSPLVFGLGGPTKDDGFTFSRAMSVNVRTDLVKQKLLNLDYGCRRTTRLRYSRITAAAITQPISTRIHHDLSLFLSFRCCSCLASGPSGKVCHFPKAKYAFNIVRSGKSQKRSNLRPYRSTTFFHFFDLSAYAVFRPPSHPVIVATGRKLSMH